MFSATLLGQVFDQHKKLEGAVAAVDQYVRSIFISSPQVLNININIRLTLKILQQGWQYVNRSKNS